MKVTIRFFASLKEILKTDRLELDLPNEIKTIGDLRQLLAQKDHYWGEAFSSNKNIRAAQSMVMVSPNTLIEEGAEIAFFPPVTGG